MPTPPRVVSPLSVDRLFRFDHASRLDRVDAALRALGEEIRVETRAV